MQFRIEYISHGIDAYVLARQLGNGSFSVSDSSRLGTAHIKPAVSQPRKLKPNGSLDFSIFIFWLTSEAEAGKLTDGEIVELSS